MAGVAGRQRDRLGDPRTVLPYGEETWRAVARLLLLSYFERVLVVQEA